MYHSISSIGNVRIDNEHANIDCMIDLCRDKNESWISSARLLIAALANHLESEETICQEEGLNMTRDHLEEHQLLKLRLAYIEKQILNDKMDKSVLLNTLRDILFYHISNFDKHLLSS